VLRPGIGIEATYHDSDISKIEFRPCQHAILLMICYHRELEVAQKERNLAQKTEELESLRDEVTHLYQALIKQLPDIQSRYPFMPA